MGAGSGNQSTWKKWAKYGYFTVIHILAIVASFLILTALAVKLKWTNDSGNVDVNNRYYEEIANQYGNDSKKDSATIARDEYIMFQRLGVLSRFYPHNAKIITDAYQWNKDVYTALRMLDAVGVLLRDNKEFVNAMKEVNKKAKFNTGSVYAWSNYTVWKQFCNTIIKDKRAIDSVSRLTGVESRIIVMCVVGEQLRMFNSGREKFKQYV